MARQKSSKNLAAVIVFGVFVALIVGFAVNIAAPAIKAQLNDWKLLPRPERLTELYIKDHQTLPSLYTPDVPQSFQFTIHNLEYRQTNYQYQITAAGSNKTIVLQKNSAKLNHNQSFTAEPAFALPDMGDRVKISATITFKGIEPGQDQPAYQQQSIYFWLERSK